MNSQFPAAKPILASKEGGKVKADLTHTKYRIVRQCAEDRGWKVVHNFNKD